MSEMTRERLDELRALTEKATPGPWRIKQNPGHDGFEEMNLTICGDIFLLADITGPAYPHQSANAAFIAASRDAVPDLLALVDELAAALEEVCMQIEDTEEHGGGAHDDGCPVCISIAEAVSILARLKGGKS